MRKERDKCWVHAPDLFLSFNSHTSSPCEASFHWAKPKLMYQGHIAQKWESRDSDPRYLTSRLILLPFYHNHKPQGNYSTVLKRGERIWHPQFSRVTHRKCLLYNFKICIITHQLLSSAAPDVFPAKHTINKTCNKTWSRKQLVPGMKAYKWLSS